MQPAEEQQWFGDVFLADGAEGVKLSEVKKALADAGKGPWMVHSAVWC